jgi:hypothetical protein
MTFGSFAFATSRRARVGTGKQVLNDENPTCIYPGTGQHFDTDQFMPALDFDANGNDVVTYYDQKVNCGNTIYDLRFVQTDGRGNILQAPTLASSFEPDPQYDPGQHGATYFFIGDYQSIWLDGSNSVFYSTHTMPFRLNKRRRGLAKFKSICPDQPHLTPFSRSSLRFRCRLMT